MEIGSLVYALCLVLIFGFERHCCQAYRSRPPNYFLDRMAHWGEEADFDPVDAEQAFLDCEEHAFFEEDHGLPPEVQHDSPIEAAQRFLELAPHDKNEPESSASDSSPQRVGEGSEKDSGVALGPLPFSSEAEEVAPKPKRVKLTGKQSADDSVYPPRPVEESAKRYAPKVVLDPRVIWWNGLAEHQKQIEAKLMLQKIVLPEYTKHCLEGPAGMCCLPRYFSKLNYADKAMVVGWWIGEGSGQSQPDVISDYTVKFTSPAEIIAPGLPGNQRRTIIADCRAKAFFSSARAIGATQS